MHNNIYNYVIKWSVTPYFCACNKLFQKTPLYVCDCTQYCYTCYTKLQQCCTIWCNHLFQAMSRGWSYSLTNMMHFWPWYFICCSSREYAIEYQPVAFIEFRVDICIFFVQICQLRFNSDQHLLISRTASKP